jgi:hypothetical protein
MTPAALTGALLEAIKNDGGLVLLFIIIFVTGLRGTWVWSREVTTVKAQLTDERIDFMRQLNEMREERDSWRRSSMMLQAQRGPERPSPSPLEGD